MLELPEVEGRQLQHKDMLSGMKQFFNFYICIENFSAMIIQELTQFRFLYFGMAVARKAPEENPLLAATLPRKSGAGRRATIFSLSTAAKRRTEKGEENSAGTTYRNVK